MNIQNQNSYKNKIVVITGSSGQIGKFAVNLFLNLGCLVYGFDLKKSDLNSKKFYFRKIDISNLKNTQNKINSIYKKHKKIDILINNAAISYKSHFSARTQLEMKKTFDVNLMSIINIIKIISKNHKKTNHCKIINIASIYGINSPDFSIYDGNKNINSEIYGGTKAAVIQITKYFAVALAKKNIIINCISPGGIENKIIQNKKFIKKYTKKVPMSRMGKVEDLESAFLYFSDQKTKYTTGQNLIIDGGLTLC
tara:strand:+ start:9724 stop:10482 length:759 start_codon:yes stop_codon:yes gene_type:complete